MRRFIPPFKSLLPYILVIVLSLPAIWPIVTPGYFPIHDNTQVVRVAQLAQSLKDGHFPVRWVKDLGYGFGYPIFNFYNPLAYYFGGVFHLVGITALAATKLMFVFPLLVAALSMYFTVRKRFGQLPAVAASAFYTYAPYHAVQIYVRGSVAEYWAYAFLPVVIYFLLERKLIASAVGLALLILSHNLTAMMAVPFLGILFFIQFIRSKKKLLVAGCWLLFVGLGLGLSAFFWVPAILEKHFTAVDQMVTEEFHTLDHFVLPRQLWYSPWGFGGSTPGEDDGLSFMLGKAHILLTGIATILVVKQATSNSSQDQRRTLNQLQHDKVEKTRELTFFAFGSLLLALFMMLPASQHLWANIKPLDFLQFPWRFLTFAAFSTSILSSFTLSKLGHWLTKKTNQANIFILYSLFFILLVLFSRKYFRPQFKFPISQQELLSKDRIRFEVSKLSDEYRPNGAQRPKSVEALPKRRYQIALNEKETAKLLDDKTHFLKVSLNLTSPKSLRLNIYSFPGWQVFLDGGEISFEETQAKHLIQLQVPSGTHLVTAKFVNTPVRQIGNIISLFSLISLFVLLLKKPKIVT